MASESDLPKQRSQLSAAKQALLDKRLRGETQAGSTRNVIPRRTVQGPSPLSFAQSRLWFLDRLDPGRPTYNIPMAWRLRGPLDIERLQRAFRDLVRRHEILRTAYVLDGGVAHQKILSEDHIQLELTDLRDLSESSRERQFQAQLEEAACQPFDLATGQVFRVRVWQLDQESHGLLINQHHIASDGWSCGVLLSELATLYAGYRSGGAPVLPELRIQYADVAVWQRAQAGSEEFHSHLGYWRKQLASPLPILELPVDRARPATPSNRGGTQEFFMERSTLEALRALAQEQGATLYMVLLAAFKVLLHRYSRQEDILVGTPVAGRTRSEVEKLVGFFVNTLVLRTSLAGDPTFMELLSRVKETSLGAFAHQDLPFERLVEELAPVRDQSVSPLFQVMFVFQTEGADELKLAGVESESLDLDTGTSKFDLSIALTERKDGLQGWFEYNSDLFNPATVQRFARHWQQLLWGIVADPMQKVSLLPILPADELRRMVVEWNQNGRDYPRHSLVHTLFEAQVDRAGQAEALVAGSVRWTYAELNRRADGIAQHLRSLGVGPEVLVAVFSSRSAEMVAGLLGVLKAGGAYVPVDPNYPADRIGFMLEDSQARVVLTEKALAPRLPASSAKVVFLDEPVPDVARATPDTSMRPGRSHLAYIIYTSGSTGRPKGVAIEHRSAATLIHWAREIFQPSELAGVLFSTSICFDLSIFELFVTLSSGGKVILAENALELPKLAAAGEVTLINTVPSAMAELVRMRAVPSGVKVVNLAGEPLKTSLVDRIYDLPQVQKVYDLYGPSEDTTYSTYTLRLRGQQATIGKPIANTQLYILDPHRQPVPIGVAGEIYLGGEGLARGYLRRPDLTEERFVPNPFDAAGKSRLYRTGDLGRFREDGNVEYLGRLDHQVKIRGFRIELGEIEAVLSLHPRVRQCVVVAVESPTGDPQLAAYAEMADGVPLEADALKRHLKQSLPDYMVPTWIVEMAQLPLTPNGKVDRRRLPAPDFQPVAAVRSASPSTPLEARLVTIWSEILQRGQVGVDENFFDLGGHSLLAVRMFVEIEKAFGRNLPLATLFHAPTIRELAKVLGDDGVKVSWSSLVPIQPKGDKLPFFCVHAAGGNVLFYRDLALRLGEQQPFYGLQPKGLDGGSERHRTIEEMAAHYLTEIRSVQPRGPYRLGGASYGGLVAWEMACRLRAQGEEVSLLALFDTHGPGYPEYLPGVTQFQMRWHHTLSVMRHHWTTFWMLPGAARREYVLGKMKKVRLRTWRYFRRHYRRFGRMFYKAAGQEVPQRLLQTQDVILTAGALYQPPDYAGVVTLYRAMEQPYGVKEERALGWDRVAKGELRIVDVPGYHGTMVMEPRVAMLVEKLKPALDSKAR